MGRVLFCAHILKYCNCTYLQSNEQFLVHPSIWVESVFITFVDSQASSYLELQLCLVELVKTEKLQELDDKSL